jgi:hypothetical protein
MAQYDVVRHRPGVRIDTTKTLEVMASAVNWTEIEVAYPEVGVAGALAPFRRCRRVTIMPPAVVTLPALRIALASHDDTTHFAYPVYESGRLVAVLVFIYLAYNPIHIYRLRK